MIKDTEFLIQWVEELVAELWEQWRENHSEHCTNDWPHEGICHWQLPKVLQDQEALKHECG